MFCFLFASFCDALAETSFEKLKVALTTPPVLSFSNFNRPLVVKTDASSVALGAVLAQEKEDDHMHRI